MRRLCPPGAPLGVCHRGPAGLYASSPVRGWRTGASLAPPPPLRPEAPHGTPRVVMRQYEGALPRC
eukprot:3792165-Prymnesium_polylepis.1